MNKLKQYSPILIDYALHLANKFLKFSIAYNPQSKVNKDGSMFYRSFKLTPHKFGEYIRALRHFTISSKKLGYEEKKLIMLLLGVSLSKKNGINLWQAANFFHRNPIRCLGFIHNILDNRKPLLRKRIILLEENNYLEKEINIEEFANLYNTQKIYLSPVVFTTLLHELNVGLSSIYPTLKLQSAKYATIDMVLNDISHIIKYLHFFSRLYRTIYSARIFTDEDIYERGEFSSFLTRFRQKLLSSNLDIELIGFLKQYKLSSIEFLFLLYLIHKVVIIKEVSFNDIEEILSKLSFTPSQTRDILKCFSSDSVFVKEGIIEQNDFLNVSSEEITEMDEYDQLNDQEIFNDFGFDVNTISISRDRIYQLIFNEVKDREKLKSKVEQTDEMEDTSRISEKAHYRGLYEIMIPRVSLKNVILSEDVQRNLMGAVNLTKTIDTMREWGVKPNLAAHSYSSVKILLYGPSGTGKTITAEALAGEAGADLFKVDASNLVASWVGESARNVKQVFKEFYKYSAKHNNKPVFMFFNEADQLLSARGTVIQAADKEYNQMQNILLEELEKLDGVFIATTNLIDLFDTAWERRFNIKIRFDVPNYEARLKLWRMHISDKLPLSPDVDLNKLAETELAGGSIANVVYNAARRAALREEKYRVVTQKDFLDAIKQEMNSRVGQSHKKVGF